MERLKTSAGHEILKVTFDELLVFGTVPPHCDSCNAPLLGENFYIPVMHSVYCDTCYTRWSSEAEYYLEDKPYESSKLNQILSVLEASS